MSDPLQLARTARENLARGLGALQSDPSLPPALLDLAQPIAQAMGALHQIERSQGAALNPHAEQALNHVRTALSQLQTLGNGHAAADQAMEAVASSLGQVHSLHKLTQGPAVAAPTPEPVAPAPRLTPPRPEPAVVAPAPSPQAYQPPAPQPAAQQPQQQQQQQAQQQQHAYQPQHQQQHQAPPAQQHQQPYQPPAPQQPQQQPAPHQTAPSFQAVADPFARRHSPPPDAPLAAPGAVGGAAPLRASVPVPSPPAAGGATVVEAALGAHSATNFYKGLSGNDIIDHGGLFVATYMVPRIGSTVRLKVSLPGGYEFEANALVKWARESNDNESAQPGFGAKLTEISPEARQLVYRYVRNREPLFHDDF